MAEAARPLLDKAGAALDRAADHVAGVVGKIGESESVAALKARFERELAAAAAWRDEKRQLLDDFAAEKQRLLSQTLAKKLRALIDRLLLLLNLKVKDAATADRWMPRFVRRFVRKLVDAAWPSVTHEINEFIFHALDANSSNMDHGEPPHVLPLVPCGPRMDAKDGLFAGRCACCDCCEQRNPFFGFRAWFLYATQPYDRGIWRKLRDLSWWFLTLVSIIPKWGVVQMFYTATFALIDRDDEFQLLRYITSFKASLFVSLGVISTMVAAAQLYLCVSAPAPAPAPAGTREEPACYEFAPREEIFTLFLFVGQVIMCWIAFAKLFCGSVSKGGLYYQMRSRMEKRLRGEITSETTAASATSAGSKVSASLLEAMTTETVEQAYLGSRSRHEDRAARRRLRNLLLFDLAAFGACAVMVLWAVFSYALDREYSLANFGANFTADGADKVFTANRNFKFVLTLYFVKALYGLCNFPWLFLVVPGVSALFSHARPTGYNRFGVCVPLLGKEEATVPWRRDTPSCCDPSNAALSSSSSSSDDDAADAAKNGGARPSADASPSPPQPKQQQHFVPVVVDAAALRAPPATYHQPQHGALEVQI